MSTKSKFSGSQLRNSAVYPPVALKGLTFQHSTNASSILKQLPCRVSLIRLTWSFISDIVIVTVCPIRLEAQDAALSRLKQGFESPMGHIKMHFSLMRECIFLFDCPMRKGHSLDSSQKQLVTGHWQTAQASLR